MNVLTAIQQGHESLDAIMQATGLDSTQARIEIKRLTRAGLIRRKNLGGYEVVANRSTPALGEAWR